MKIFTWNFVKRSMMASVVFGFSVLLCTFLSNKYVISSTKQQIYDDIDKVPKKKVALVLGAAKSLNNNVPNPYFYNRIEAAAELYHAGKVEQILVSGDNHVKSYNEPEDMMHALVMMGVPEKLITLDFAGFRTFDSMIRAKEVFQIDDFIVVSQEYHLQRAIYIGNSKGIKTVGYNAKGVKFQGYNLREYLAKFKAVLDCNILFTQPKFLGVKEEMNE